MVKHSRQVAGKITALWNELDAEKKEEVTKILFLYLWTFLLFGRVAYTLWVVFFDYFAFDIPLYILGRGRVLCMFYICGLFYYLVG